MFLGFFVGKIVIVPVLHEDRNCLGHEPGIDLPGCPEDLPEHTPHGSRNAEVEMIENPKNYGDAVEGLSSG